jgi:LysR family transcriptional regulator, chromosome initiation inhibitor
MLDNRLIEALALVVQEGGFDKAARALYITQSAVSQRLKLLEEITGQVLIARTTPPQATLAGKKFLKHYLQVKRLEDDLMGEINETDNKEFTPIALGVNADSLAFWLLEAIHPFLLEEKALLDIRVNDQEQTHRMLKDGEVMGCISSQDQPIQGCRIEYLGRMNYRLMATPEFATRWFPDGLTLKDVRRAPALIFDRNDELLHKLLYQTFEEVPTSIPAHYVPSVEKYAEFIALGHAYGSLPDQQSKPLINTGQMVDLSPDCHVSVKLYWHCWNLKSVVLENLTQNLIRKAKILLKRP